MASSFRTRGGKVLLSLSLLLPALHCASLPAQDEPGHCAFDTVQLRFVGSAREQARCLLSPVGIRGEIADPLPRLPDPLECLVGRATSVRMDTLRGFLSEQGIAESALGGSLDEPLSRADTGDPGAPLASYFVIHDTSWPNLLLAASAFPAEIDAPSWSWNQLDRYRNASQAHLYVTRDGQSTAAGERTFATPWRATQREMKVVGVRSRGLFLHIENVQPRRSDPRGTPENDDLAPLPGFPDAQLDRLALVYVAASVRRGSWLIPAYHAVLDDHPETVNRHDDPQNFDLPRWAQRLGSLLDRLGAAVDDECASPRSVPGSQYR